MWMGETRISHSKSWQVAISERARVECNNEKNFNHFKVGSYLGNILLLVYFHRNVLYIENLTHY